MLYPSSYTHARNLNYFILELIPEITTSLNFYKQFFSTLYFHFSLPSNETESPTAGFVAPQDLASAWHITGQRNAQRD